MSNLEHITIDHERQKRCGFTEVVYAEGKTKIDLLLAIDTILEAKANVLATRVSKKQAKFILKKHNNANFHQAAKTLIINPYKQDKLSGKIVIVSAGTSDMPVTMEAYNTCVFLGCASELISDVGVAGVHRLLNKIEKISKADVVIVIAGMDGALPSVVAGLISSPVIAVPTSVGYGVSFKGVSALLTMLNSCASGVTVTNIDNGFGAACAAFRILNKLNILTKQE